MVATRQDGTRVLYRLADKHPVLLVEQTIKQAERSVSNDQDRPHHHHIDFAARHVTLSAEDARGN